MKQDHWETGASRKRGGLQTKDNGTWRGESKQYPTDLPTIQKIGNAGKAVHTKKENCGSARQKQKWTVPEKRGPIREEPERPLS